MRRARVEEETMERRKGETTNTNRTVPNYRGDIPNTGEKEGSENFEQ